MNTKKGKDKGEKAKSDVFGFGLMGHGMSGM
jgi:selenophosphate synthase